MLRQPWALAGAAALLLPLLVHLLSRAPSKRTPFPSLRFIDETRLPPRRLTTIHELPLLLVRMAIVGVAVLALAQPLLPIARATAPQYVRAVIVDTSASMRRALAGAGAGTTTAADSARALARALADSAAVARVMPTVDVARAIDGAVRWLDGRRGTRELVIVSDFRGPTVDSSSIALVPTGYGVRLQPIATPGIDSVDVPSGERARAGFALRLQRRGDTTLVRTVGDSAARARVAREPRQVPVLRLQRARTRTGADTSAPAPAPAPSLRAAHRVAALRLAGDPLLRELASEVVTPDAPADPLLAPLLVPLLRNEVGAPVVAVASRDSVTLDVVLADAMGDASATAFGVALDRAVEGASVHQAMEALEEVTTSADVLRRWSRAPADTVEGVVGTPRDVAPTEGGASDARWFWLVVLLLLGVEWWMRRR